MRIHHAAILLVLLPLLGACADVQGEKAPAAVEHATEVAWFQGDTDAAFALAKKEGRPLLLYWGAEWCPPCHELKTKVFHTAAFVDKSREFVAVYLDADTEHAQVLGEQLGVTSYPTVLIFSPDGQELMRMPTDVSAERFVELLDVARVRMRPVHELLDEVLRAGAENAAPADLNVLAFHSWGQDTKIEMDADQRLATFRQLYERTPDSLPLEKSRFLGLFLEAAAGGAGAGKSSLTTDERSALQGEVTALLADPELRTANLPLVAYSAGDVVRLLQPQAGSERDALVRQWEEAARHLEDDDSLSVGDRLTAILPRVELARLDAVDGEEEPPLPAALSDHIRERVTWAAGSVTDDSELQSVMSTMVWLLEEAGLSAEAETLLTERMNDAHAPYYFMSKIAGMKQAADRPDEAVTWFRKAYDSARGRYTRFRWGSIYLRKVMELEPEDAGKLESASFEILGEVLTFDDAFAGGNYMRLRQLESAYQGWNESGAHDAELSRIRELVHGACERYPADDAAAQQTRCASFLTELRPEQVAS